jgi:uncharacterized protein (DUF433 family)
MSVAGLCVVVIVSSMCRFQSPTETTHSNPGPETQGRPRCIMPVGLTQMAKLIDRPLIKKVTPVAPEHLVGDLIQSGHPLFGLVWINPERVSGAPCFYGTRVPIKTLFDSLAAGQTLEEFLDDFEGVSREQAEVLLQLAGSNLLEDLPKP